MPDLHLIGKTRHLTERKINGRDQEKTYSAQFNSSDRDKMHLIASEFQRVSQLDPQPRGYAFEKFLKSLFDAHGFHAREAFRLVGQQIDGSFTFENETYLLEAKWCSSQTGYQDLMSFDGRLSKKASWTRGLFVSYSGFSEQGLQAVGTGNKFVCMNGDDIIQMLDQQLPLDYVMGKKVRHAAETGQPFLPVCDF